jgi:hypothetical protein
VARDYRTRETLTPGYLDRADQERLLAALRAILQAAPLAC